MRGTVFGIANAFARVGGMLAPPVSSSVPHFMLLIASLGVLAFLLAIPLKETRGVEMPDLVK